MKPCPYPKLDQYKFPSNTMNLDLGCANKQEPGFVGVDICSPKAQVICDIEKGLPFDDNSIGYIRACHIFEHLDNFFFVMDECHRVLREHPDSCMFIAVPRGDHWHSYGDPEHKRRFHPNQFMYFTPFWHYENRAKKWELMHICWCRKQEITCILRPVKSQGVLDELYRRRDEMRQQQGHEFIFLDAEEPDEPEPSPVSR